MQLTVTLEATRTLVTLPDEQGQLEFSSQPLTTPAHGLVVRTKAGQFVGFGAGPATEYVAITVPWTSEPEYLQKALQAETIPQNQQAYVAGILQILTRFGVQLTAPAKKRPAKIQHRFTKALSDIPFVIDYDGAKATVYWRKRNEMEIMPGALLSQHQHVTKDGALGIDTRFGEKLRADHQAAIQGEHTIASVVLRSANEVGLFLYYGGTNAWLQLKDAHGKTLDAWTQVQ